MGFECLDIVGINIPCEDVTDKVYLLDDLGLSLADAASTADERYITGRKLVEDKIEQAKRDVLDYLTKNVTDCAEATVENVVCNYADRVAKAIWYRSAALIYKDLSVDSSRFNEIVAYGKNSAIVNCLLYDSSFEILAQMSGIDGPIPPGQYQIQQQSLEIVRQDIELYCCTSCVGTRYQFVLP